MSDKQRETIFTTIMGNTEMPDEPSEDYDRWLFDQTWQAREPEIQALRIERDRYREVLIDANRYQRLRVLGCAPGETKHLENGHVLRFTNLDEFLDNDIKAYPSRGEVKHLEALPPTPQAGA